MALILGSRLLNSTSLLEDLTHTVLHCAKLHCLISISNHMLKKIFIRKTANLVISNIFRRRYW